MDQNVSDLPGTEQINPLAEQVLVLVAAACMDQPRWAEEFLEVGRMDQQPGEESREAGHKGPEKLASKWVQTGRKNRSVVALSGAGGQKAPLWQGGG